MVLYVADASVLKDELYDLAYKNCSEKRKIRADKFKFVEDKRQTLAAEILLKKALSDLNIKYDEKNILISEHGKPYLKNNPVFFNISHSKNIVICAVSKNEVGCDIEKIKDIDLKIAKRFFTENEYEEILQSDDKIKAFYLIWTHKESYLKAKGTGITENLNSFDHNDYKESFNDFDYIDGYFISVCDLSNMNHFEIRNINLEAILKPKLL